MPDSLEVKQAAVGLMSVANLAGRINEHHRQAYGHAAKAIEHARQAGELLIQAKSEIPHGGWIPWLEANCEVGEREAQRYMRLASRWHELKSDTVTDLSLRAALEHLTEPRVEAEADEITKLVNGWYDDIIRSTERYGARSIRSYIDALPIFERAQVISGAAFALDHIAMMSEWRSAYDVAPKHIRDSMTIGREFFGDEALQRSVSQVLRDVFEATPC